MFSTKKIIGWVIALGAVGAAALLVPEPSSETADVSAGPVQAQKSSQARSAGAEGRFEALPSREPLGERRGDLFSARSWAPPPAPARVATAAPAPSAGPTVPPMPYRVAGQVMHDGAANVVLARNDRVYIVREGEELDGGYRVESIQPDRVTLLYEPLGVRNELPVLKLETPPAQAAADARPAQLRWEGPERVQAGTAFNVALKLTSKEPLRASPLQLSFDAALLEPVDVRAGRYFADGMFSYRVNPAGSIFVGASGKGAEAADAELLVVRFKPIRAGATAELKLSSVSLQSHSGQAIAHDQPAAFRTAIVQ